MLQLVCDVQRPDTSHGYAEKSRLIIDEADRSIPYSCRHKVDESFGDPFWQHMNRKERSIAEIRCAGSINSR